MMNYKDPQVELIPAPQGIDKAIQAVQAVLAAQVPWLEKVFGRCTLQIGTVPGEGGRAVRVVYGEVYNQREPYPVMVNDNLQAYCFFHALDPLKFEDYDALTLGAESTQRVAIIVWANMEKIDGAKNYNFVEELRGDMVRALKKCAGLELTESFLLYDRVFQPFTITETFVQFLKPPYAAMRIEGKLSFDYLNCIP